MSLLCFSPEDDKDAPVQGPLPYEPDDAPWKKSSESGIRKLYVYFFLFICNIYLKCINFIASEKYSLSPAAAFLEVAVPDEVFLVFQRWPYLVAVPVIHLYNAFLKIRWIILNN